jgi:GrpB-like predicted nucleotidyltransferase (UPF0157 family)
MTGEKRLEIVPYDPAWPAAFEREAARLRRGLVALALRIEHNGSTSVPGLAGKPVIDIQVSVASLQPLAAYARPLEALGYRHVPHADDAFCPFFHRPSRWPHTHHLHVVQAGGDEERRTLAFRDHLRRHPGAAREYEELKRGLAQRIEGSDRAAREAYTRGKAAFIERMVAAALAGGAPEAPGDRR